MKGIVQAVKRRMHKDDRLSQEPRSLGVSPVGIDKTAGGSQTAASSSVSSGGVNSQSSSKLNVTASDYPSQQQTSPHLGLNISSSPNRSISPSPPVDHVSGRNSSNAGSFCNSVITWANAPMTKWQPSDSAASSNVSGVDIDGIPTNRLGSISPGLMSRVRPIGQTIGDSTSPSVVTDEITVSNGKDAQEIYGASDFDLSLSRHPMRNSGITFPIGVTLEGNPFAPLPLLRETQHNKRLELLRKKLLLCAVVFDFSIPNAYVKEKEIKRATLCELVDYVNNAMASFNEQVMADIVNMVSINIFRVLPPSSGSLSVTTVYEPEDDEPRLECAWPHLQVVYEFFRRIVVSNDTDPKMAKRYIDQAFILKLLRLFDSEDPRERDYLKTILHRIYGKIMALRSFIRKSIQHLFYESVYEREIQHGIAELLEILGSIINGFALPLKEEHKMFLERALIPLHKPQGFVAYHQYLAYCMSQYVEKDSQLAETIILKLLKFWPVTNTTKEVLFINEIEEILELTQMTEFTRVMVPLFQKLSQCIQSSHFQVAERVLFLWNNDHIVKMINDNRNILFPILIKALYMNSRDHWNTTVNCLTYNVSKLLAQADPTLFDDCSGKHISSEERQKQEEIKRVQFWKELQVAYDSKTKSLP